MGTLKDFKRFMRSDKELSPMLVHSFLHEAMVDINGDRVPDIALIDDNHDGDIDTIAIDVTSNGDFNLYFGDSDCNGIIDTVKVYKDYDEVPIASYFGRNVEKKFKELGTKVYSRLIVGEYVTDEILSLLKEIEDEAKKEYEQFSVQE